MYTIKRTNKKDYNVKKKVNRDTKREFYVKKNYSFEKRTRFVKSKVKLKSIDITLMRKLNEISSLPFSFQNDGIGSYFYDELENQNNSEHTEAWISFYLNIIDDSQSLPIVLLKKKKLVDYILDLFKYEFLFKNAIKLLIALLRDLKNDVYIEYKEKIFPEIIKYIDITNISKLELIFNLIASSFKFLVKSINEDIEEFYKIYVKIYLNFKNEFIKKFAIESFSYVIKKAKKEEELSYLLNSIYFNKINKEFENINSFLGYILFDTMKGFSNILSFQTLNIYNILINKFIEKKKYSDLQIIMRISINKYLEYEFNLKKMSNDKSNNVIYFSDLIKLMFNLYQKNNDAKYLKILWEIIMDTVIYRENILLNNVEFKNLIINFLNEINNLEWIDNKLLIDVIVLLNKSNINIFSNILSSIDFNNNLFEYLLKELIFNDSIKNRKEFTIKINKKDHVENENPVVNRSINDNNLYNFIIENFKKIIENNEMEIKNKNLIYYFSVILYNKIDLNHNIINNLVNHIIELIEYNNFELFIYCNFINKVQLNPNICGKLLKIWTEKINFDGINNSIDYNIYYFVKRFKSHRTNFSVEFLINICLKYLNNNDLENRLINDIFMKNLNCIYNLDSILYLIEKNNNYFKYNNDGDLIYEENLEFYENINKLFMNKSKKIRQIIIKILGKFDVNKVIWDLNYNKNINFLKIIENFEIIEVNFENERIMSSMFTNLKLELQSSRIQPIYYKSLMYYLVSYSFKRLSIIKDLISNIISIIINKDKIYFNELICIILDFKKHKFNKINKIKVEYEENNLINLYNKTTIENINIIEKIKQFEILTDCIIINGNNSYYNHIYELLKDLIFNDNKYNIFAYILYKEVYKMEIQNITYKNNEESFLTFYNKNSSDYKKNIYEDYVYILFKSILTCFSNCKSLNNYEFSNYLFDIFKNLLKSQNDDLKNICFKSIFLFGNKILDNNKKKLNGVFNTKEVKSMVYSLNLENMTIMERNHLVPVLVNIIISILMETKTGRSKTFNQNKKFLLLNYLSNLKENELSLFINEILLNYNLKMNNDKIKTYNSLSKLNIKKILSWISFIKLIIKSFKILLLPYITNLLNIIFHIINYLREFKIYLKNNYSFEVCKMFKNQIKIWNKNSIKVISEFYANFVEYNFEDINDNIYLIIKNNLIDYEKSKFSKSNYILNLISIWSEYDLYKINFMKYKEIKNIFLILKNEDIEKNVEENLFDIFSNLLNYSMIELSNIRIEQENKIKKYINQDNCYIYNRENNNNISLLGKKFINSNVDFLIDCFYVYFNNKRNLENGKKMLNSRNLETLLYFLENLEELNNDNSMKLISIFKDFLKPKYINKNISYVEELFISADKIILIEKEVEVKIKIFKIVSKLLVNLENPYDFIYEHLLPILVSVNNIKILFAINEVFRSLKLNKSCLSIGNSLKYIIKMTAKKRNATDSLNYDNIYNILNNLNNNKLDNLSIENIKILSVFILKLLLENDSIIRNYSIEYFKTLFNQFKEFNINDKKDFMNYLVKLVIPNLNMSFSKSKYDESFNSFITFYSLYFEFMSKNLDILDNQESIPFIDLIQWAKDKEFLFFLENITSIKINLKIKSIETLKKFLINFKSKINIFSIKNFFFLIFDIFIDGNIKESKERISKGVKESRVNTLKNLLNDLTQVIGICSGFFEVREFCNYVKEKIFFMKKNPYYENITIKVISESLNNLPNKFEKFDIINKVNYEVKNKINLNSKESIYSKLYNYDKEMNLNQYRNRAEEFFNNENNVNDFDKEEIKDKINDEFINENLINISKNEISLTISQIKLLKNKILIPLKSYLNEKTDSGKVIKIKVASSMIKIVRLLPFELFKVEFIKIIYNICSNLKNKSQETRNNARLTLLEICKSTGPYFFYFILNEMKVLLSNGLVKHIRNYTLGFLLENLVNKDNNYENGSLDNCIELILEFILDELFGQIDEEKQAKEIQNKSTELKKSNAIHSMKLLGNHIKFDTIFKIINEFKSYIKGSNLGINKIIKKTEEAFSWLINGLVLNQTIETTNIIYMVYILNKDSNLVQNFKDDKIENIEYDNVKPIDIYKNNLNEKYKLQDGVAQNKSIFSQIKRNKEKKTENLNKTVCNFSINLLYKFLKKGKIDFENMSQELINDFYKILDQLVTLLDSQYNEIVTNSLNIISLIYDNPMFEFKNNSRRLINSITRILSTLTVNDLDMLQICFKMIKKIILSGFIEISSSKINAIFSYLKEFLYISDFTLEPLNCLSAIVSKKIIKPDIYNLIDNCIEIFLKSNEIPIRNISKNIVGDFIENYPLNDEYIKNFINILLKNLDLDQMDNKLDLISLLTHIIEKFPEKIILEIIDIFYFNIITNIVNEKEYTLKDNLNLLLLTFFNKIINLEDRIYKILGFAKIWLKKDDYNLKLSGIVTIINLIKSDFKNKKILIENIIDDDNFKIMINNILEEIENYREKIKNWKIEKKITELKNTRVKLNSKLELHLQFINLQKELIIFSEEEKINKYLDNILKLMYHPNEIISQNIINCLFDIFDRLNGNYNLLNDNLKDIILFSYIIIRKKSIKSEDIIYSFYAIGKEIMNYLLKLDYELLNNYIVGLYEIVVKNLRELDSNIIIIERIIVLLNLFLNQDLKDLNKEVGISLIKLLVKLKENSQIKLNIDISESLEDYIKYIKSIYDNNFYLKHYTHFKNLIFNKRQELKANKKLEAITDPENYAKKKVLLSKKRRKKKMDKIKKKRIDQQDASVKKI